MWLHLVVMHLRIPLTAPNPYLFNDFPSSSIMVGESSLSSWFRFPICFWRRRRRNRRNSFALLKKAIAISVLVGSHCKRGKEMPFYKTDIHIGTWIKRHFWKIASAVSSFITVFSQTEWPTVPYSNRDMNSPVFVEQEDTLTCFETQIQFFVVARDMTTNPLSRRGREVKRSFSFLPSCGSRNPS